MPVERKQAVQIITAIFLFALGFSLFSNLPALQKNFLFADEATYYMITQSLAQNGDLEYTRNDLIDYYRDFDAGPLGIFLKEGREGKIYFAKSWVYPLFAAPFFKVFGGNGFLIFHSFLLFLILLMGYYFLSSKDSPPFLGILGIATFFFASAAAVYFVWITPDFFNFFLVFAALFLWLYKHKPRPQSAASSTSAGAGRLRAFLCSDGSDYLACALAGIACFSKPPNIALMGPLVLYTLMRKRLIKALIMTAVFVVTAGLFFWINQSVTGDWDYQGGKRKTFYGHGGYPLEKSFLTFDAAQGLAMSSEGYTEKNLYPARVFARNFFYYFFGRFSGITWYFFPAVLALLLFFLRRKESFQWMILAALAGEILIYIVLMPDNYAGGASIGNRYFLSIYPFFFFLTGFRTDFKTIGIRWAAAALLIAPILVNPLQHSHFPYIHVKKIPFKWMPVEVTLVNNFPTNANPAANRQEIGEKYTWLYFLDDNFLPRTSSREEKTGFWTRGPHRAEVVMKTYYPIDRITFRVRNNRRQENRVTVVFSGVKKSITLGSLQWGTVTFASPKVFRMNQWIHLYQFSIDAEKGSIPHFETDSSDEKRYLGVWFEVDIVPVYMPD